MNGNQNFPSDDAFSISDANTQDSNDISQNIGNNQGIETSANTPMEDEPNQNDIGLEEPEIDNTEEEPEIDNTEENEDDDSTISIIKQLNDTDKEAVRSYAQSMLNKSGNNEKQDDEPLDEPLNETFVFKKKQIDKINEIFKTNKEDKKVDRILPKKEKNKVSKKSPFNSPKFK